MSRCVDLPVLRNVKIDGISVDLVFSPRLLHIHDIDRDSLLMVMAYPGKQMERTRQIQDKRR